MSRTPQAPVPMTFAGFPAAGLNYLDALAANNNRDWFEANRTTLETQLLAPARAFCAAMLPVLDELGGAPHGVKIWRMHRDLRFSRDKTPYNAHLHISFFPEQAGSGAPAWYFGIDTAAVVLGCGRFAFSPAQLEAFRTALDTEADELGVLLQKLRGDEVRLSEPELKKVPRGFEPTHPQAEHLRRKGLTAWADFADRSIATTPDFLATCNGVYRKLAPLQRRLVALGA